LALEPAARRLPPEPRVGRAAGLGGREDQAGRLARLLADRAELPRQQPARQVAGVVMQPSLADAVTRLH
jgi:hypothetical protein